MRRPRHEIVDEALLAAFPDGVYRAMDEVARDAGIRGEEVSEALSRLESAGYTWERHPGRGLRLMERSHLLLHSEVVPHLETRWIGRSLHFFRTLGSTNDFLLSSAFSDFPAGTVVVSEEQTKGRGRHGRAWQAPPFRALQFSVLLKPEGGAEQAALCTLAAGTATCAALGDECGLQPQIRWPNDLTLGGKKICGILSEYRAASGCLVVGIGLNVNQRGGELPPEAGSLRVAVGRKYDRGPILARILNRLEEWIDRLRGEGFGPVRAEAERLSNLLGKKVTLELGDCEASGLAVGIGPQGGLLVRAGSGEVEYRIGEVTKVVAWEGG